MTCMHDICLKKQPNLHTTCKKLLLCIWKWGARMPCAESSCTTTDFATAKVAHRLQPKAPITTDGNKATLQ